MRLCCRSWMDPSSPRESGPSAPIAKLAGTLRLVARRDGVTVHPSITRSPAQHHRSGARLRNRRRWIHGESRHDPYVSCLPIWSGADDERRKRNKGAPGSGKGGSESGVDAFLDARKDGAEGEGVPRILGEGRSSQHQVERMRLRSLALILAALSIVVACSSNPSRRPAGSASRSGSASRGCLDTLQASDSIATMVKMSVAAQDSAVRLPRDFEGMFVEGFRSHFTAPKTLPLSVVTGWH